jgi:putative iron-regulated protein
LPGRPLAPTEAVAWSHDPMMVLPAILVGLLLSGPTPPDPVAACVRDHATLAASEYSASLAAVDRLREAIRAFAAEPSESGLARARAAWIEARWIYGRTECFRFGGGPIDGRRGGVEIFVNAWPVDESYLDTVPGATAPGLIADPVRVPVIERTILRELNQRGGETNVCTGWHAIEFLLWGQDRSEDGPGARPASDFVDGQAPFADRRRTCLVELVELLRADLSRVVEAWKPGPDRYRDRFVADPESSLRSILTGVGLLTGFEMSGERLATPLETRDEEEEHSCFSDTTHVDFRSNIDGVARVLRGHEGGTGAIAAIRSRDPEAADAVARALDAALPAVAAMPVPFDRAIRTSDGSDERKRLVAAMEALEELSERISAAARSLGYRLPTEPQG